VVTMVVTKVVTRYYLWLVTRYYGDTLLTNIVTTLVVLLCGNIPTHLSLRASRWR
jgi:hypothetical protein